MLERRLRFFKNGYNDKTKRWSIQEKMLKLKTNTVYKIKMSLEILRKKYKHPQTEKIKEMEKERKKR